MLRLLGADFGARFTFLSLLPFHSLASLVCTCRSWRSWIDFDSVLPKQKFCVPLDHASDFAACVWACRHLHSLSITRPQVRGLESGRQQTEQSMLHASVAQLVAFPHLRSLEIFLCFPLVDEQLWHRCFAHLTPTLEALALPFSFDMHFDSTVAAIVKHLDKLARLTSLTISGLCDAPEKIDISVLPKLPRLQSFTVRTGAMDFLWSARQLPHLCNCKQLVSLSGGFGRPEISIWEQRVIDFIESRFPAEAPPLPAVTRLALPALTPAVWSRLTRLTSLEALEPYKWVDFGAEGWTMLTLFTALRRVMLQPVKLDDVMDASLFVNPLSSCVTLESLEFGRVRLSEHDLALLTKGLPLLSSLSFNVSILESLSPLSFASALTKLNFHHCKCFDDIQRPFDICRQLPPLFNLTQLSICPVEGSTLEEQEALGAVVMARLPALRPLIEER